MKLNCPECGSELFMNINVFMQIPSSMESQLSKKNISKKDVKILGANWDKSTYGCTVCNKYYGNIRHLSEYYFTKDEDNA